MISTYNKLSGYLSAESGLNGNLSAENTLSGILEPAIQPGAYSGPYEVVPKAYEAQELETANKLLTDNVQVKAVPIRKNDNLSGGVTVYIADLF